MKQKLKRFMAGFMAMLTLVGINVSTAEKAFKLLPLLWV